MPIDDAIKFMKEAAKKSYSKKGDAVVEMNYKAIDAGVDAIHKVEVPDSWANPEADAPKEAKTGRPEVVKLVNDLLEPISKMDGDSLPVSAFKDCADGQFETGASAYEKRGQPLWFLSGIQQPAFSVTAVHLFVHMQQSDHLFFQLMKLQQLQQTSSLQILSML